MEDVKLEHIAQLMSKQLKKWRRISPISAADVVKMPDNYKLDNRKRTVYAACVDEIIVTATVWEDGYVSMKANSVY